MLESIDFETSFDYETNQIGITVPVKIRLSNITAVFDAKIDTGTTFCVFARKFGEEIGIEIAGAHYYGNRKLFNLCPQGDDDCPRL